MDEQSIDRLAKTLVGAPHTRRRAARMAFAATAALAGWVVGSEREAVANHHHAGRRRRHRNRAKGHGRNRPPRDCAPLENCFFAESPLDPRPILIGSLPGAPIPTCWKWRSLHCEPCNGTKSSVYNDVCNETYSTCEGKCQASSA